MAAWEEAVREEEVAGKVEEEEDKEKDCMEEAAVGTEEVEALEEMSVKVC